MSTELAPNCTRIVSVFEYLDETLLFLLDVLPSPVFIKNTTGQMLYANPAMLELHKADATEIVGKFAAEFMTPELAKQSSDTDRQLVGIGMSIETVNSLHPKSGGEKTVIVKKRMIELPSGERAILGVVTDISCFIEHEQALEKRHEEISRQQDRLEKLATLDPLTGIFNRRAFYDKAAAITEFAKHDQLSVGVLMFDLDRFKQLNDTYGHAVGDDVLMQFTDLVKKCIRQPDIFARLGGEEFVLLLPQSNRKAVLAVAERIRITVEQAGIIHADTRTPQFTTSAGGTMWQPSSQSIDQVMRQADAALYEAKLNGRNRVCFKSEAEVAETSSAA